MILTSSCTLQILLGFQRKTLTAVSLINCIGMYCCMSSFHVCSVQQRCILASRGAAQHRGQFSRVSSTGSRTLAFRSKPCKRDLRAQVATVLSPDVVKSAFTFYNTVLLLPWLLMIFAPNLDFTKSIIKSNAFLILFCVAYAYLFVAATAQVCLSVSATTLPRHARAQLDKRKYNGQPEYACTGTCGAVQYLCAAQYLLCALPPHSILCCLFKTSVLNNHCSDSKQQCRTWRRGSTLGRRFCSCSQKPLQVCMLRPILCISHVCTA